MFSQPVTLSEEELALRGIRIPPQPQVLSELEKLIDSGSYDARSVARVIERDPGIAAMLFKVARSPLFGGHTTLSSLDKIIIRLGFRQTLSIARAVALSTTLSDGQRHAFNLFWEGSRELALLAARVAEERVSICNIFPEQAYMAGIFFRCGIPVLMQRFPDYCTTLLTERRFDFPSLKEEDQRFNVDHGSIGYLVARHWHLPDFIAQAILYSAAMPRDEQGATRSLVAILHLADHLRLALSDAHDPNWPQLAADVLAELCLPPDEFPEYLADMREHMLASGP